MNIIEMIDITLPFQLFQLLRAPGLQIIEFDTVAIISPNLSND